MSEQNQRTADEVVFEDDLAEFREEITEEVADDVVDRVTEEIDVGPDQDAIREEAERSAKAFFQHVVDEQCDDPTCNEVRDALGSDAHDHDEDPDDEPDADADDDPDDDPDADDGDPEGDADADAGGDGDGESGGNYAFSEEFRK